MKRILNILFYILKRVRCYHLYSVKWCNDVLAKQKIVLDKTAKQKCKHFKEKWRPLSRLISGKYFRIFANYTDCNIDVVPEDVLHHIIEPVLNPFEYQALYEDKNFFAVALRQPAYLPKELLRCIRGFFYSADYEKIDVDSLYTYLQTVCLCNKRYILKPSVNSCSGRGIVFFEKKENDFILVGDGIPLMEYLKQKEIKDFVVQECLRQSAFMAQFNESSINTIRVCVYKSIVTNESHVTAAIMRIGRKDSLVDNAHAGGAFVGIALDGTLGKYVADQYGTTKTVFNDVDFSKGNFVIPHFDRVIEFSKKIADACVHHHLFALDVMVNENDEPVLIEYNLTDFSSWLFEFTGNSPFGLFTDEIIDYCAKNKNINRFAVV